jgi:hypothetical protein
VQLRPVEGDTVAVRLTTPLKPWRAVTVMVEVPETALGTVTLIGLAAIVKSWTV